MKGIDVFNMTDFSSSDRNVAMPTVKSKKKKLKKEANVGEEQGEGEPGQTAPPTYLFTPRLFFDSSTRR